MEYLIHDTPLKRATRCVLDDLIDGRDLTKAYGILSPIKEVARKIIVGVEANSDMNMTQAASFVNTTVHSGKK